MILRKIRFWKTTTVSPGGTETPHDDNQASIPNGNRPEAADNVVSLPLRNDIDIKAAGIARPGDYFVPRTSPLSPARFKGLMNAPELTAFFEENYFGLGRHNGAHYRTREALELGKNSLIAKFQNTLTDLIERNQTKVNKLHNELIAIEGVSAPMSAQLRLACEHVQRDISVLQGQIDSAREGKGWILEALNRYQIGYSKGLREAIDFELLAH